VIDYHSQGINNDDIKVYIENTDVQKLNKADRDLCDQDIKEKEVEEAICNLKQDKTPGIDGLTPEFYKKFWEVLKRPFMAMVNESFLKEKLPTTLNQAVLTLIFKKGEQNLLKNYRPISITNYDYKIIAFVLVRRLQKVINTLIHTDQSGYIKGRFIGNSARYILDFFEYCEKYNTPGVILNLDFEKVFDRLEWNFMFETLRAMNFGDKFTKWIHILYNKPVVIVKNNGWLSKSIFVERGIRQGCPISALLFILSIELMAINIRHNDNIKGMNIKGKEKKLSQYADDSTLTLTEMSSIGEAIDTINRFCAVSGMKLNKQKTEGIWVGCTER